MGLSELTAFTAETWGCSRRNARDVVAAAHKDWLGADAKKAERDRIVTWNLGVSLYPSVGGCAMQSQGQSYE